MASLVAMPQASATTDKEATETTDSVALREVVVTSRRKAVEVIPVQTLSGSELELLGSVSVADALRYFAGVQV